MNRGTAAGTPMGSRGNAIPRDAQVLAVADAFDAMTSDRPSNFRLNTKSVPRTSFVVEPEFSVTGETSNGLVMSSMNYSINYSMSY